MILLLAAAAGLGFLLGGLVVHEIGVWRARKDPGLQFFRFANLDVISLDWTVTPRTRSSLPTASLPHNYKRKGI